MFHVESCSGLSLAITLCDSTVVWVQSGEFEIIPATKTYWDAM